MHSNCEKAMLSNVSGSFVLLTGSTLKEHIARSQFTGLDSYTALMLMQNLLRILLYLKSKPVIHNDIKGDDRLGFRFTGRFSSVMVVVV